MAGTLEGVKVEQAEKYPMKSKLYSTAHGGGTAREQSEAAQTEFAR